MIEVIDRGATTESHPVPLLFVHGACSAAWCWDEHFLDYFADRGYRAVALSLRGHGASSLSKALNSCSIADYVDDVHAVAGTLGVKPVLIGHSMGCWIILNYLATHGSGANGTRYTAGNAQVGMPRHPPTPVAYAAQHHLRHSSRSIQNTGLGP